MSPLTYMIKANSYHKAIIFLIGHFIFVHNYLLGQNLRGLSYSNYSGTHGLYQNPASIADNRHRLYVNIFAFDLHAENSFVNYNGPYAPFHLTKKIARGEKLNFTKEHFKGRLDGDRKMFSAGLEVRGPSLMYAIDDFHSIAITTRLRGGFQINNMSEALARIIILGEGAPELQNLDFFRKRFNLNMNTFGEIGISYATILMDDGTNFIKGGLTLKRLAGINIAHLSSDEVTYRIHEDPDNPGEHIIHIDNMRGEVGFLSNPDKNDVFKIQNWFVGNNMPGSGFGFDIGFVYEKRPVSRNYSYQMDGRTYRDNTFSKYDYKLSLSILDVGGIRYRSAHMVHYMIGAQNLSLKLNDFEGSRNASEIGEIASEIIGAESTTGKFTAGLPSALNLNFDYKILNNLYLNTIWMPGLRSQEAAGMRHYSFVSLVPRFEMKHLEFSVPLSLVNNYHSFSAGAMARLGPLFIGSDNLLGLMNVGKPHGFNFYTGLTFALPQKKLKDRDMDGISDKLDKCPDVKGQAKTDGCPDADFDGIPDHLDHCPDLYGPKSNNGCPVVKKIDNHNEIQVSKEDSRIMKATYENLAFETGKVEIDQSSAASLDKMAELLLRRPGYKLLIEGHTDNTGIPEENMTLSQKRADAVKDYLILKGVPVELLITQGHGAEKPIASNDTEEGRKQNRRVTFKFIQ